jgi:hypothetical protein
MKLIAAARFFPAHVKAWNVKKEGGTGLLLALIHQPRRDAHFLCSKASVRCEDEESYHNKSSLNPDEERAESIERLINYLSC